MTKEKVLIIRLDSYAGDDTYLDASPNPLYCIVNAVTGEVLDNGYRSFEEARAVTKFNYNLIN
jgi:hypothetical protein